MTFISRMYFVAFAQFQVVLRYIPGITLMEEDVLLIFNIAVGEVLRVFVVVVTMGEVGIVVTVGFVSNAAITVTNTLLVAIFPVLVFFTVKVT